PKVETLTSEADGAKSAQQIYSSFVAPPVPGGLRPFDDAQVDGIDLYVLTNEPSIAYVSFVRTLRALMDGNGNTTAVPVNGTANSTGSATATVSANATSSATAKAAATTVAGSGAYKPPATFTISATVGCSFPSAFQGPTFPNRTLTVVPDLIDYIVVAFRASAGCSWGSTKDGFWNATQSWSTWVSQVANGTVNGTSAAVASARGMEWTAQLPNFGWGYEVYEEGMTGDFIAGALYTDNVIPRWRSSPRFTGVSLFDSSFDQINKPCVNDSSTRYSDVIWSQLQTADVALVGTGTPTGKQCVFRTDDPLKALSAPVAASTTTAKGGATFAPTATSVSSVTSQSGGSPLSTGAIIGIVSGAGGGLGILAFIAVWYRQYK
ncbi:hypothetical protein HDU93_002048, partial [Gonapodya sp. JEL0774]